MSCRQHDVPAPYVQRCQWRAILGSMVVAVAVIVPTAYVVLVIESSWVMPDYVRIALYTLPMGLGLLGAFQAKRHLLARLRTALRRHDMLLCRHCGYPLVDRDRDTTCSECGAHGDASTIRQLWLEELARDRFHRV